MGKTKPPRKLAVFNSEHTAIPVKGDWIIIDEDESEFRVERIVIDMTKGTMITFVPWYAVKGT